MQKHIGALLLALLFISCSKTVLETTDDVCTKMDDINFMKYCYANYDANGDGKVSMDEARAVKEFSCAKLNVSSVKGIEYFANLERLTLDGLQLTHFDPSPFQKLKNLSIRSNKLTNIDCSRNPALKGLDISYNSIAVLDLSKCQNLTGIACTTNKLTNLVLPASINQIWCEDNKLSELNLSSCPNLEHIYCGSNSIKTIDVSGTKWKPGILYHLAVDGYYESFEPESASSCFYQNNAVTVLCNQSQFDALPDYFIGYGQYTTTFSCGDKTRVAPKHGRGD